MKTKKNPVAEMKSDLKALGREVTKIRKSLAEVLGTQERHSDLLTKLAKEQNGLDAKLKKLIRDPIVSVPRELAVRVEGLGEKVADMQETVDMKASLASVRVLTERLEGLSTQVQKVEAEGLEHDGRLTDLEVEATSPETRAANAEAEPKCRCAKGLEGKDPDCYLHGNSFDKSDRPSTSEPENNGESAMTPHPDALKDA